MTEEICAAPIQSPLTCLLPLRDDVDVSALKAKLREYKPLVDAALEKVGTVHFARFVVFERQRMLGIITEYDGDFDTYIGDFALHLDDVFNLLFKNFIEYPPQLPVKEHPDELMRWVKARDAQTIAFYSAYPDETVVDVRARTKAKPLAAE
jgi:hypothetical protein